MVTSTLCYTNNITNVTLNQQQAMSEG